ncbi:MAG: rod shape-determining protein RodA [Bacteroidota bacterium]
MSRRGSTTREIDWLTIFLYFGLVVTGWLMIYSVSYTEDQQGLIDFGRRHGSQLIWMGASVIAAMFVLIVDNKFYRTFAFPIYFSIILLLVAVLLFGQEIAGSRSWFNIGGFFKFQPSEFAKFATCLGLANYLSGYNVSLQNNKSRFYALGIIFLPLVLILLQGDAGSALVFTSFLIVLFREGMPALLYIGGILIAALSIVGLMFDQMPILCILLLAGILLLSLNVKSKKLHAIAAAVACCVAAYLGFQYGFVIHALVVSGMVLLAMAFINRRQKSVSFSNLVLVGLMLSIGYTFTVNYGFNNLLKPHQQDRINVWLQPSKCDPLGSLYNLNQSKLAIASGGIDGKGFLEGPMTQLKYVPEQPTDFIFCTIGEEHGFLGSFGLIVLFLLLLLRITEIAERQRSKFSRHYAYGVAGILFFHFIVNIGMTIGLMPIIGIPLPFISYGGSSLLSFTILLFILIKLDSSRLQSF